MTTRSDAVAAYLQRLGLTGPLEPGLETLVRVHRAHLDALPYENLAIMLGRPPSADPADSLARVGESGRAGYCFHQNGALELVLAELGFAVSRRHAHVYSDEAGASDTSLNHLALVVELGGALWWADTGLGDGLRDPLPVAVGRYDQGGFAYEITEVRPDGWSFRADPRGSFLGIEVTSRPVDQAVVDETHVRLSTPPDGQFSRLVVVQRRGDGWAETLRGCLLTRVSADGETTTELASYDAWRDALAVPLDGFGDDELRALYDDQWAKHLAWRG